ncbi:MAG: hypothetical protein Q8Q08_06820 [Candidatus Omnitrophota bacterium]|nr:hypothetical protein [Candidatus Omnitrophota bacterium]
MILFSKAKWVFLPAMFLSMMLLTKTAGAGYVLSEDFKITLSPITTEIREGSRVFRVKARLEYTGATPIELKAGNDIFARPDAGFLERSTYFGALPPFSPCSLRQVEMPYGGESPWKVTQKTFQPGEVLEEEWVTDGRDINPATFEGKLSGGGDCIDQPGEYRVKVLFGAWMPNNDFLMSAPSNEQRLDNTK